MMLKKASSSLSSTHSLQIQTQSEGQVAREGWLKKKGHLFSTIKSRFFVLATDGHLAYFKDNKKKKQKGLVVLDMSDTIMPLPTKKHDKVFGFELKKDASGDHNAKAYSLTMFASSDPERTQWIEALRRVTTVQFVPPTPRTPALSVSALSQTVLGTVTSNPRDTFCVLIEIGELQQLVTAAKTTWDIDPLKWSQDQYLELCRSIVFTHEKAANANMSIQESQVLKDALELRYKYEDAQAQVQARRLSVAAPLSPSPQTTKLEEVPEPTSATEHPPAEKTLSDAISLINRPVAKYFASLDPSFVALSPRSKTIAKYAHLYQEEALIAKRAWNILREDSDDVLNAPIVSTTTDDLANLLNERFQRDRIYTNVGNTMLTINPAPRLVHHAAGNSIYDETTVMWYRDHDLAQGSPHPFALAKQTLSSIQDNKQNECIILIGESGSGKTDFGKHVLKYFATVQHALKPPHVQLYTSSTKSTIKMRSDESHLMDLLRSKQITYETIYLDISPEKWPDMLAASGGLKQLPQLHMEKLFFGNYDELQRLEDEEQLVFYLKNPLAARLTSILLDSNILLETFGNARTVHNPNSSRFGKSTTFSVHATTGQLLGGSITPFFLETSRVTNANPDDANFHIFYSLLVGASDKLASECHLKNTTPSTFAYLGKPSKSAPTNVKNFSTEEDRQRWQRGVKISSAEELKIVASLLSVDINTLERSLCTRQLSVAKKDEVYELQVHEPQARVSRDTLARLLYESLFTTLVSMLNKHSKAHEAIDGKACEITLVDVFGFEDIGFNSFEQLCINYLTERPSSFELDYAGETVRMWLASRAVGKLRETTRNYIRDITQFYAKYNPTKLPEVPDIVRAFRGRENVLFEKLQQKYLKDHVETPSEEAIDTSLEDFILKVHFDAITVQQMLLNPKIALLLGEPRILQALREVSIDPSVIYLQTNDPVLRLFYTEMRSYLTTSVVPKRTKYQDMPLEDAVEKLAHLQLLKPLVGMTPEEQDALSEIATDPSLLPFHIDQPGVRTMLQRLIKYLSFFCRM
ncbi:unnamed protein product [Aphanomyces euteiches]